MNVSRRVLVVDGLGHAGLMAALASVHVVVTRIPPEPRWEVVQDIEPTHLACAKVELECAQSEQGEMSEKIWRSTPKRLYYPDSDFEPFDSS